MSSFRVVKNDFPKVAAELEVGSRVAEDRAATRIVVRARAAAPVDTGRLRASITHRGGEVYTDDRVARYQEYGTRKMAANPFFFQAVEGQLRLFELELFAILKRHS